MEIKEGLVLASEVGGGLPCGCVVSPFYLVVEAILIVAIEQALELPFYDQLFGSVFSFKYSAAGYL